MTDKQQIEEMAMELYNNQDKIDVTNPYEVAELIYKAGYRKVDENAVVLTREEKQKLLHEMYEQGKFDIFIELGSTVYDNTRKKTAKEIFTKLIEVAKNNDNKISIGVLKAWAIEYEVEGGK